MPTNKICVFFKLNKWPKGGILENCDLLVSEQLEQHLITYSRDTIWILPSRSACLTCFWCVHENPIQPDTPMLKPSIICNTSSAMAMAISASEHLRTACAASASATLSRLSLSRDVGWMPRRINSSFAKSTHQIILDPIDRSDVGSWCKPIVIRAFVLW